MICNNSFGFKKKSSPSKCGKFSSILSVVFVNFHSKKLASNKELRNSTPPTSQQKSVSYHRYWTRRTYHSSETKISPGALSGGHSVNCNKNLVKQKKAHLARNGIGFGYQWSLHLSLEDHQSGWDTSELLEQEVKGTNLHIFFPTMSWFKMEFFNSKRILASKLGATQSSSLGCLVQIQANNTFQTQWKSNIKYLSLSSSMSKYVILNSDIHLSLDHFQTMEYMKGSDTCFLVELAWLQRNHPRSIWKSQRQILQSSWTQVIFFVNTHPIWKTP